MNLEGYKTKWGFFFIQSSTHMCVDCATQCLYNWQEKFDVERIEEAQRELKGK